MAPESVVMKMSTGFLVADALMANEATLTKVIVTHIRLFKFNKGSN